MSGRAREGGSSPSQRVGNLGLLIPGIVVMEVHQGTVTTIGTVIPESMIINVRRNRILLITAEASRC